MKTVLKYKSMKPALIIAFFIIFLYFGNAEGAYQSRVISENDTAMVVLKKNYASGKIHENFLNITVAVVPDTTRDIIIIFRNVNQEFYNSILDKNLTFMQSEEYSMNNSAVSKNSSIV